MRGTSQFKEIFSPILGASKSYMMPDTPSPDLDVREAGGWAEKPCHYPPRVDDDDLIASLNNGPRRVRKDQQRQHGELEWRKEEIELRIRKERLQQQFPGLAQKLRAEVKNAPGKRQKSRQAKLPCSGHSTSSDSSTSSIRAFGSGRQHRTTINA